MSDTQHLEHRILPLGDRCLVLEAEASASREVTLHMRALADALAAAGLPGVLDLVPAFCSLAIHYDPAFAKDPNGRSAPWEHLRGLVEYALARAPVVAEDRGRRIEIPVRYGGAQGEDLESLAKAHDLTPDEAIDLHAGSDYFVGMLGFAPGFPYLAGLDARLITPRRATPRARVPAGSVAIGGEHTGIYPFESPGGWHLIGRTPLRLFDLSSEPPCRLEPGDTVRFVPVGEEEYKALAREREWR